MNAQILRILLIEDDEDDYVITCGLVARFEGWQAIVEWASSYESALRAMKSGDHDVCLIDYRLGEHDGLDLLRHARSAGYEKPIIFLTGAEQREADLAAMEAGAADYLLKENIDAPLLERSIRYAIEHTCTLQSLRRAVQENNLQACVIDSLRSGVLITDPRLPDNPIIYANPGFTALTGYSTEEVLGRNCRFLQGPDTDPVMLQEIREAISNGRPFSGLLLNYRKDGMPFHNGLVIQPLFDDRGQLINFVGLQNDVSAPREQLRSLAARLTQVREEERTHLAREIHDVLGQALTGLKMDLSWLSKRAANETSSASAGAFQEKICAMSQVVDSTIGTVRELATQLRPSLLDDLGLEAAVEWQVQEFEKRSGISCHLVSNLGETEMNADCATALFRILQETLTNVARHAHASDVEVRLHLENGNALLQVHDNGRGITARELSKTKSLGLLGIRERALLVGGKVDITGVPQKGTTVLVRVPQFNILPGRLGIGDQT